MIKKIKEWFAIAFFALVLLGGLFAPFYTPNFGVIMSGESLYMPTPYM